MKTGFIPRRKKLGEIVVEEGKISPEQMNDLFRKQK